MGEDGVSISIKRKFGYRPFSFKGMLKVRGPAVNSPPSILIPI